MHTRNLAKILGLSLLAAVGVMAVSASAAQAKWQFLLNGKAVSELKGKFEVSLGFLLVPGLNLKMHCTGGTGTATLTGGGTTTASGTAKGTFEGCKVKGSEATCTILGKEGEAASKEKILAEGKGALGMSGAETETLTAKAEGKPFAAFLITGPACTLPEEAEVSGSIDITILEALKDLTVHLAHANESESAGKSLLRSLFGEESRIDGALKTPEGETEPEVLAHIRDEDPTATTAIHLIEL